VTLGDQTVLERSTYFYPTSFGAATLGRNELGAPENVAQFSGDLRGRLQFGGAR
jgi:hypothetical protein